MKVFHLALLAIALTLLACKKDKEPVTPAEHQPRTNRSVFGCDRYSSRQLADPLDARYFNEMAKFGEYFLYAGSQHLLITQGFEGPVVVDAPRNHPCYLLLHEERMLIYSRDGIQEFFDDGRLELVYNSAVFLLTSTPTGNLLGTIPASDFAYRITEFNTSDFSTQPYTPPFSPPGPCSSVSALHPDTNSMLWGLDCSGNLLQMDETGLLQVYTAGTWELWGNDTDNPLVSETHFLSTDSALYIVAKRTPSTYQVLRHEAGTWHSIFAPVQEEQPESLWAKTLLLMQGTAHHAAIFDNKLYVCTSFGIHEIDLSKGYNQKVEDVLNIFDLKLDQERAYFLYEAEGVRYLLNTQKTAVRLRC
jgi:hypothetical protein